MPIAAQQINQPEAGLRAELAVCRLPLVDLMHEEESAFQTLGGVMI